MPCHINMWFMYVLISRIKELSVLIITFFFFWMPALIVVVVKKKILNHVGAPISSNK
jgi:hypothetical protein